MNTTYIKNIHVQDEGNTVYCTCK